MQQYRENEIAFYGFRAFVTDVPAVLHRHCKQIRFRLPNDCDQRLATLREPNRSILSRVRCIAQFGLPNHFLRCRWASSAAAAIGASNHPFQANIFHPPPPFASTSQQPSSINPTAPTNENQ
jgi:hypothetical protein